MSGKVRQRAAANSADSATQSTNEKILKECHTLYTESENGLCRIADSLGLTLLAPRKKITVLLIGNHSAGKSSFINWYIEEHVQRTGVAIETQGFTFVTSGRKRESLTGNATLHLYPHFEPLREIEGVVDYIQTEISTSKQKKFSLVTFVDTPGLVDGDMKYPFNVNDSILWLGDLADLIFVFFDPIGQALCKRTLNLVEMLNEKHADRMRFFLSKADEAGHETDRQRVMMQIVQELCKRPGLNHHGFDMPTIYIPSITGKPSRCANQIEEVCKEIEKTINLTIQNTLNSLERDCESIAEMVDTKLQLNSEAASYNLRTQVKSSIFCCLGMLMPLVMAVFFLATSVSFNMLADIVGKDVALPVWDVLKPCSNLMKNIPESAHLYVFGAVGVLALLFLLLSKFSGKTRPTLTRRQKRALMENREYVQNIVKKKKQTLYQEYLHQSVAEHDL